MRPSGNVCGSAPTGNPLHALLSLRSYLCVGGLLGTILVIALISLGAAQSERAGYPKEQRLLGERHEYVPSKVSRTAERLRCGMFVGRVRDHSHGVSAGIRVPS